MRTCSASGVIEILVETSKSDRDVGADLQRVDGGPVQVAGQKRGAWIAQSKGNLHLAMQGQTQVAHQPAKTRWHRLGRRQTGRATHREFPVCCSVLS